MVILTLICFRDPHTFGAPDFETLYLPFIHQHSNLPKSKSLKRYIKRWNDDTIIRSKCNTKNFGGDLRNLRNWSCHFSLSLPLPLPFKCFQMFHLLLSAVTFNVLNISSISIPQCKHRKSAKLPWPRKIKLSFWSLYFFLSFCLYVFFCLFVFLSFCLFIF